MQQALNGNGYAGTATFNAPVVNPSTWSGSPIGTGSFSVQSSPAQSGGPQSISADDASQGTVVHYVIIGNLQAPTGALFGIISTQAFAVGTLTVDNVNTYAGLFDATTGEPTAMASAGTVTFTAVGSTVTGTFNGTLEDYAAPPGCRTNADCAQGEICQAGTCVAVTPPGCTSNAQCPSGSTCQAGQCVATPQCTSNAQCPAGATCQGGQCVPTPQCTSNAQCPAGTTCQGGQCVATPGCTSNAQCGSGATCVNGTCVVQGACRIDADCPFGQVCSAGQCVPGQMTGVCQGQGQGAYSGTVGAVNACSAIPGGAVSVTQGFAGIGQDQTGTLSLFVFNSAAQGDGVELPLSACPSGPGTQSVSGAQVISVTSAAGVTLYASRDATGSISFTTVSGSHLAGTFSLTVSGGGSVTGSFDVQ